MRKKVVILCLSLLLCMLNAMPAFANSMNQPSLNTSKPVLLQEVKQQRITALNPRGTIISTGVLQISNPGNGEIGVFMQTLTHKDIDKTMFGVYLDRWVEEDSRWANVATYTFNYDKEEYPDEDLSMKSISFNIIGQPADCYYRLRGAHMVILDGTREMLSSETDGILITK